jgi:hypothetical protein
MISVIFALLRTCLRGSGPYSYGGHSVNESDRFQALVTL